MEKPACNPSCENLLPNQAVRGRGEREGIFVSVIIDRLGPSGFPAPSVVDIVGQTSPVITRRVAVL